MRSHVEAKRFTWRSVTPHPSRPLAGLVRGINKSPVTTKAERRQRRKRPRMKVQGASVKKLQQIIIRRAKEI
ncbi:MAG: hypothetical protein AAB402_03775 [Patescibacteria group bacterium]